MLSLLKHVPPSLVGVNPSSKYVPIFVNFVQLGPNLLTPFKSLTAMNSDCHVSLRGFFEFFFWIIYLSFWIFLNVPVSTQYRVTCHFVVFFIFFYFFFLFSFFKRKFKCPCVNLVACHVSKSIFYIQFGPYICYFCSI